jgi:hypothetical protein
VGAEPLDILYVAAKGRSGSTILGRILGAVDGFAYVGEVRLGLRSVGDNRLCGCGTHLAACPTWQAVARLMGGPVFEARRARPGGFRTRHLPAALLGADAWLRSRVAEELEAGERLYRAIQAVTGARVLVDSSKSPAWGLMLALIPSVRLHVIHLVRDPRAVAYSWTRRRPQADNPGREVGRRRPGSSAVTWALSNAWAELCWRRATGGRLRLRYEDFAAHPRPALAAAVSLTQARPSRLPFVDEHTVELPPDHAAAGNMARMATGRVLIRPDEEWRFALPAGPRRLVAALTYPLMRRYGYAGDPGARWDAWRPAASPSALGGGRG